MKVFWTGAALLAALLVQTVLSRVAPGQARLFDPFLLVLVYCGLVGGEGHGMLAGLAAGWVQDVHFGGPVVGLSGLAKLVVGFGVGMASTRFLLNGPAARVLVVLVAALADALLLEQVAIAFQVALQPLTLLTMLTRAVLNALVGGMLYELLERRLKQGRR